ncbi:copper amine oxidase N-terminal domain-containing protein [Paenibacillus favisporus]|uniref:copper amine oxidase N-terminal domain-containing protein n=1 Tax=Paenibacillus favisporus TaxID=221028 RepID=UPI001F0D302B|nr:copper amine oxidase N-terminal domain-containing protein [Paenibacillus favisporus]
MGKKGKSRMKGSALRNIGSAALAGIIMLAAALPAWADSSSDKLTLQLKTGSTAAVINGQTVQILKPFKKNGTVMVPLGVFSKAFGSEVKLEKNNVVKIGYGPHQISLTIDSHLAWVDGRKVKLEAAPSMMNGTLMVPLRVVAQGIGAQMNTGSAGEWVISLKPSEDDASPQDPGIDSDVGKTKIGNSYYGWTMNYPSGLIVGSGDETESIASFNDAEEKYYIEVHASDEDADLSTDDLLDRLVEDAKKGGEMVVDRGTFPKAKVPYARIVTKDGDGTFWECRMYSSHNRLYELYFADLQASNYKDLNKYAGLLNSFDTSFNPADKTVKDLSTVKNGMRGVYNEDYGIALDIPADWSMDNADMYYESKDGSYLKLNVSTGPKGDSLDQWGGQMKKWLEESFVKTSYEVVNTYPLEVSGEQALVNEARYNYGDGWIREYEVMILKDGYRYYVEYAAPEDQPADVAKFKDLMNGVNIDFTVVPESFGSMEENTFLIDKSKRTTKTSKTYQYQIRIPQYWSANRDQFELSPVEYQFVGGRMMITAEKDSSFEEAVSQLKAFYNEAVKYQKDLKLEKVENTTFAGEPAVVFSIHQVKDGIPYSARQIVVQHNGTVYTLSASLNDANATDIQKKTLDETLNSFTFTKKDDVKTTAAAGQS